MDLATIVGLLAVIGLIIFGILIGSSLLIFIDAPSIVIVGFGTVFIPLVAYPASEYKSALLGSLKKAFLTEPKKSEELLTLMRQMSTRARREGAAQDGDHAHRAGRRRGARPGPRPRLGGCLSVLDR